VTEVLALSNLFMFAYSAGANKIT